MNERGERAGRGAQPDLPEGARGATGARASRRSPHSLAYLGDLKRRGFDFVLVNCEDITTWGGRAADFSNPTHVNRMNMQRMLRYVVAHSEGALTDDAVQQLRLPVRVSPARPRSAGGGCGRRTLRLTFLTLASWLFYGWWDWRFVPLLIVSTVLNFFGADS